MVRRFVRHRHTACMPSILRLILRYTPAPFLSRDELSVKFGGNPCALRVLLETFCPAVLATREGCLVFEKFFRGISLPRTVFVTLAGSFCWGRRFVATDGILPVSAIWCGGCRYHFREATKMVGGFKFASSLYQVRASSCEFVSSSCKMITGSPAGAGGLFYIWRRMCL